MQSYAARSRRTQGSVVAVTAALLMSACESGTAPPGPVDSVTLSPTVLEPAAVRLALNDEIVGVAGEAIDGALGAHGRHATSCHFRVYLEFGVYLTAA
jgi:hypothetical protein